MSHQATEQQFRVQVQDYESLSPEEQMAASDNGHGKEWANYIRVTHNGQTLYLENDAIEPEDKSFRRDLNWIVDAILKAYELGRIDGSPADVECEHGIPINSPSACPSCHSQNTKGKS